MNTRALFTVLIGAMCFALYNVATKKLFTPRWQHRAAAVTALHQLGAGIMLLAMTVLTGGPHINAGFWFAMCATGCLNIGIQFAKMKARALEDVSLVTPIDSTTPAIVILTSMMILGERTSPIGWLGIMLVAIGTYVLNIEGLRQKLATGAMHNWRARVSVYAVPFTALGHSQGVRWAFFAVALSTVSLPYDGLTARTANIAFGLAGISCIAGLGNVFIAHRNGEWTGLHRRSIRATMPLALLFAAGSWFTEHAYLSSSVPYVGTMKRFAIPLTIILAYFMVGERNAFRGRLFGGLIMVTGAFLIAIA